MSFNSSQLKKLSVVCIAPLLALSSSLSHVAASQTTNDQPDQPSQGLPGRRAGGGSRGCRELQGLPALDPQQVIALTPQDSIIRTAVDYPTLFFRIPHLPSPKNIEFVLRDERDSRVYKTTFSSPRTGGILSVPLPASAMPPLTVAGTYQWYFSIICDDSDRAKDIVVEGTIQRVAIPSAFLNELQQASPNEQVDLFMSRGLWHDALATVIMLRQDLPSDPAVESRWDELLASMGLSEIAQEIILSYPAYQTVVLQQFSPSASNY